MRMMDGRAELPSLHYHCCVRSSRLVLLSCPIIQQHKYTAQHKVGLQFKLKALLRLIWSRNICGRERLTRTWGDCSLGLRKCHSAQQYGMILPKQTQREGVLTCPAQRNVSHES
jgi:hypothetical protein